MFDRLNHGYYYVNTINWKTWGFKMLRDLDEIKKALTGVNVREVAREIGVSHQTLYNILNDFNLGPDYRTLKKINEYIDELEREA